MSVYSVYKVPLTAAAEGEATGISSPEIEAEGVTNSVGVGVSKTVGVGVGVGVIVALGMGMYLAASTPIRIPKRIKAITIKNVFKKPDLGLAGVTVSGIGVAGAITCGDGFWNTGWEIGISIGEGDC